MKQKTKITLATSAVIASAAYAGLLAGSAVAAMPSENGIHPSSARIVLAGLPGTYGANAASESGKHDCKGKNACKGQGGCDSGDGGCKGKNSCKGKGGCATDGSHK